MKTAPFPGLFWLASYPKSGNTWTRAFLANLLAESAEPIDINHLRIGTIASSREWVEDALGFDISELSHDEIDALRPAAYRWRAVHDSSAYHKIHDAYTTLPDGTPLIPRDATRGAVYLVRNPLDVACSFANHSNLTLEQAVDRICSSNYAFYDSPRRQANQLRQHLSTWSEHVLSWLDADIPKLVVRYEDLRRAPHTWFAAIASFFELERPAEEIAAAIAACRFEHLRQQEISGGFIEKAPNVKHFFRRGLVGSWRDELSPAQVRQIISVNRLAMERLDYLNAAGELTDATG